MRTPWTARRSNQSILREINPEYSLEGLVLKKTPESPLDSKEIKPVNPKRNQPGIFIGRTDTKAKAPILWPPDGKRDTREKTLMLGKTEGKSGRRR